MCIQGIVKQKRDKQIGNGSFHLNKKIQGGKKGLGQLLGTATTPAICRPKLSCWEASKQQANVSQRWQAEQG